MNNYIYFDLSGNPLYTASYSNDDDIPQAPDNTLVKQIDESIPPAALLTEYWLDGDEISHRGPRAAEYFTWDTTSKTWVDTRTPETQWIVVRAERDQLLSATDWTQLPDVPQATQELYRAYRQELRDITQQEDAFNIVWPVKP